MPIPGGSAPLPTPVPPAPLPLSPANQKILEETGAAPAPTPPPTETVPEPTGKKSDLKLPSAKALGITEEELKVYADAGPKGEAVLSFDRNKDGQVGAHEYAAGVRVKKRNEEFKTADANNDGAMDATELKDRYSAKELKEYDINGDGKLNRNEYGRAEAREESRKEFNALGKGERYLTADTLGKKKTKEYDRNGDGKVGITEYKAGVHKDRAEGRHKDKDTNGDGKIQLSEFGDGLKAERYDKDHDGVVSFKEAFKQGHKDSVQKVFESFDKDGDGKLKGDELSKDAAERWDANGDGWVTGAELLKGRHKDWMAREFKDFDRNDDGKLTGDELGGKAAKRLEDGATLQDFNGETRAKEEAEKKADEAGDKTLMAKLNNGLDNQYRNTPTGCFRYAWEINEQAGGTGIGGAKVSTSNRGKEIGNLDKLVASGDIQVGDIIYVNKKPGADPSSTNLAYKPHWFTYMGNGQFSDQFGVQNGAAMNQKYDNRYIDQIYRPYK